MMVRSCFAAAVLAVVCVFVARLPAQEPARGRGEPPVVSAQALPAVMAEDPQTANRSQDRVGFPGHKIIGNLYYVGTVTLCSYLVATPAGNIIINSNYEETLPLMKTSVESLGFRLEDTKILLASHAHADHQSADALFKQMTGATTMFMEQDVPALRNMKPGGKEHPIDRVLKDGDTVSLGGVTLTAHLTPGHTAGTTTWTLRVPESGRTYDVVIIGGGLQDEARLVYNTNNPNVADEWASTIKTWRSLPVDVFLGAHSWFFNLTGKYKRLKANPGVNPYIDPEGYRKYVDGVEQLRTKLIAEQTAAGPPPARGRGRGEQGRDQPDGRGREN
jgi:metallo-beta-lactamase class B